MTQTLITRLSKLDAPDREVTEAEREQYRKEYREAVRNCWKDNPGTMDEILEQQSKVNVLRPGRIALLRAKEASK